jgi:glycine/D-amino acid oxidase-like deaminating enzyme
VVGLNLDLVVVGAGIVGSVVAEEARRRAPAAKILMLDAAQAGSGATRYSAALSTPTGATDAHRRLVLRAERWYAELEGCGGPRRRHLITYWVVPESEVDQLRAEFVSDPPVPIGPADRVRLSATYPDLVVRPDEVVLRSAGVWAGRAAATAQMLAARLNQSGSSGCWEGVRVDDVQPDGAGQVVLTHTGERLHTRHVVLATGAWLADDARRVGWPLRVKKVAALHLARRPALDDPVVIFCAEDAFLLPLPEQGLTLFSFYCPTWDVRPARDLMIEPDELAAARAVLAARSPSLVAAVAGGRAAGDGYLPARLPSVAEDPTRPGVVVAGGCSGSGFQLAPALAESALAALDRFAKD